MKRPVAIAAFGIALAGGAACSTPKPEPEVASSSNLADYARDYPAKLDDLYSRFLDREREAKKLMTDFASYPDQLKTPDWSKVGTIYARADEAGRSESYVERRREVVGAQTFFAEEKDELTRKVAGSAQYAVKKKQECDVDVYGPTAYALKDAFEKQLEKRLRARNEGQALIEKNRDVLGKENAATLEKQADDISLASYLVNIEVVELKVEASRTLAEIDQVKATLDRAQTEEASLAREPGRSPEAKKASDARTALLLASSRHVDAAAQQLKGLTKDLPNRVAEDQKAYTQAFGALQQAVKSRSGH